MLNQGPAPVRVLKGHLVLHDPHEGLHGFRQNKIVLSLSVEKSCFAGLIYFRPLSLL
jgi:hypothetical protein